MKEAANGTKPVKKFIRPYDREAVAKAQFRTGAGPLPEKRKDPRRQRRRARLEEQRARRQSEE